MAIFVCLRTKDSPIITLLPHLSYPFERIGSDRLLLLLEGDGELLSVQEELGQFALHIGIGPNRLVAEIASSLALPGLPLVVAAGEELSFLSALPLTSLPIDEASLRKLDLLGFITAGDLLLLSKEELYLQLGYEGLALFELIRGIDSRPFSQEASAEWLYEEGAFDEGCTGGPWLEKVCTGLLERLFVRMKSRGVSCMRLLLGLTLDEGREVFLEVPFAFGTREVKVAWQQVQKRLAASPLSSPIIHLSMTLQGTAKTIPTQLSLFTTPRRHHLFKAVERLCAKENPRALTRLKAEEPLSRLPERRFSLESLLDKQKSYPILMPRLIDVKSDSEGTPHALSFRAKWCAVASLIDGWEVEDEWWREEPIRRTYFRVSLANGGYKRLFYDRTKERWYTQ